MSSWKYIDKRQKNSLRFRSEYSVDYLSIKCFRMKKMNDNIVAFDEIHNYLITYISIRVHMNERWFFKGYAAKRRNFFVIYLSIKMIPNEKSLDYKFLDIVESYNFHIKFIIIWVHKKLQFLKTYQSLPLFQTAVGTATVPVSGWNPYCRCKRR
jgi:hypothetical protein